MDLIALTGGIASGKSTVAARFASHGAIVIDADVLAREVIEPGTPALARIAETFGTSVISGDGTLNRPALGAIVFEDSAARLRLNAITHPAVWARAKQLIALAGSTDPDAVVIYDVPLLVEAAGTRPIEFEKIIVVDAPSEIRIRRLVELRGMSREEAESRVRAQAGDDERRAVADILIDSSGSLDHTLAQVDAIWQDVSRVAG